MKFITAKGLRIIGSFFLFLAIALAFAWFYWLAPMRHLQDWDWFKTHSPQRRWIEEQKKMRRSGIDHDSSISVGRYGDKKWAAWVIHKLNSAKKEQAAGCGKWPYHLDSALPEMTNQRMTNNAAWLDWWEQNKDKTQLEWIREGFAKRGITLEQPLTTNNIICLLKLVRSSTNFTVITNIISLDESEGLRYNALRWLRDAGFRPCDLDFKTVPIENKDDLVIALINYAQWRGENWNAPGKLEIGNNSDGEFLGISPAIFWVAYLLMSSLTAGGVWLLRRARCKERRML